MLNMQGSICTKQRSTCTQHTGICAHVFTNMCMHACVSDVPLILVYESAHQMVYVAYRNGMKRNVPWEDRRQPLVSSYYTTMFPLIVASHPKMPMTRKPYNPLTSNLWWALMHCRKVLLCQQPSAPVSKSIHLKVDNITAVCSNANLL